MNRSVYAIVSGACRFVHGMYVRHRVVHGHRLRRAGPFVLACTHHGYLEPAVVGTVLDRPVHWLAREEFFRSSWSAAALRAVGAIELDRRGVPVRAVRAALARLGDGKVVGIFPEGGRVRGDTGVVRGGPIRGGACLLALRAGVPVVPVVVLGVDRLAGGSTWVPGRRTAVRTIVGPPLPPPPLLPRAGRRDRRRRMTADLKRAFVALHQELLATVPDEGFP